MKISVKFLAIHLATCFSMGVPFAKAQPSPPTCVQQCQDFCAAVTSNFVYSGTGSFSDTTLDNLYRAFEEVGDAYGMGNDVRQFQTSINMMQVNMSQGNFLAPLLSKCQQSYTYCSQECSPPFRKSIAQKPNAPLKKPVLSK